jgi:thymidylate kinase
LVTLSGTHGSGKSTNAGRCYYLLNKSGFKFSYLRHQDLLDPFGFVVRRAARILRFGKASRLEGTSPVRVLWSFYILFIYLPALIGGIRLRNLLGYSVVCDRYVYDFVVGFRDNQMSVPLEQLLLWVIPRPDAAFVLDAPATRILADRPEHTSDYIRQEREWYQEIADHFGLIRISTEDPPGLVWTKLRNVVESITDTGRLKRDVS